MGNDNEKGSGSVWELFFNMLDRFSVWVERIYIILRIAVPVIFIAAFGLLFIRFYNNGWSFFNKKAEISINNPYYAEGMKCWEELDYVNAMENLNTALEQIRQSEGEGSVEAAAVSQKLGALCLDLGRYEESYEFLNSAYVVFYNNLGQEDGNTIITKCQISVYDIRTGNVERGFAALYEAFDETKYVHYKRQIVQMIAQCHMLLGNYTEALQWYKLLETIYQQTGISDLILVNLYNDYGVLMMELGEYESALEYFMTAEKQWQSLNSEEDLTIANVYVNAAKACICCGRYEDAMACIEKGTSIYESLSGSESIHAARAYENTAAIYGEIQKPDIEMEYLEMALEKAMAAVGKNHEVTAEIYNAIGTCYLNCGEIPSAIENYEEALEIRKNLIGKKDIITADIYYNLAECYNRMEQYGQSIEYAKEAVAISESLFGRDNINTAQFYIGLAWHYEKMGNEEEAGSLVRIVMDIVDRHNSISSITVAQTYLITGDIYLEQGCFEDAYGCYRKSWQIYQEMFFEREMYASEFDGRLERLHDKWNGSEELDKWMLNLRKEEFTNEER